MLTIYKLRRYIVHYYIYTNAEAYLEPRQISKMELFMKIVNGLKLLTIFSRKAPFLMFDRVLNVLLKWHVKAFLFMV